MRPFDLFSVRRHPTQLLLVLLSLLALLQLGPVFARAQGVGPLSSLEATYTPALSSASGALVPPFAPGTFVYDAQVPFRTQGVVFRLALNDTLLATADPQPKVMAKWNEGDEFEVTPGEDTEELKLDNPSGLHSLELRVSPLPAGWGAADGSDTKSYFVSVSRALLESHNAALISLTWLDNDGNDNDEGDVLAEMNPQASFSSQVFGYAVRLASGVQQVRFMATVDSQATLAYRTTRTNLGPPASTDAPSDLVQMTPGSSGSSSSGASARSELLQVSPGTQQRVDVFVVAEDGFTARNYSFVLGAHEGALPAVPSGEGLGEYVIGGGNQGDSSTGDDGGLGDGGAAAALNPVALWLAALLALAAAAGAQRGI